MDKTAVDIFYDSIIQLPQFKDNVPEEITKAYNKSNKVFKKQITKAVEKGFEGGIGYSIDTEWGRDNEFKISEYYKKTYQK
jgi:hypothetical protein